MFNNAGLATGIETRSRDLFMLMHISLSLNILPTLNVSLSNDKGLFTVVRS